MDVVIFTDVNGTAGFGRYAGAYRIATELRQQAYSTQVIEFLASMSADEILDLLDRLVTPRTLFIGFATSLFANRLDEARTSELQRKKHRKMHVDAWTAFMPFPIDDTTNLFARIKRSFPHVAIVVGGRKVQSLIVGRHPPTRVDFWIHGEADRAVIALADHLRHGQDLRYDVWPSDIGDQKVIFSRKHYPYVGFPKSTITWEANDHVFPGEHLPLEVSRGCVFRCKFCDYTKVHDLKRTTSKDLEFVKNLSVLRDEILRNYDCFGTTGYMLTDDTYNDSIDKVRRLHQLFTSLPFRIEWSAFARIDMVHAFPEMADMMIESGARSLFFGVETLNPKAGKLIGKGLAPEKTIGALEHMQRVSAGRCIVGAGFIAGLPGEPRQSIEETMRWLKSDACPVNAAEWHPLFMLPYNSEAAAWVDYPEFAINPERYGIRKLDPAARDYQIWQTDEMNFVEAFDMIGEFESSYNTGDNNLLGIYASYSRMRNLGFTHEEVYGSTLGTFDWTLAESRHADLRDRYLPSIRHT